MHGFVFQAIGPNGTSAGELGRRLGVSKQAAGKTIDTLVRLGYVERVGDPNDARRKVVRLTDRGHDCLVRSFRIFESVRAAWERDLGTTRIRQLEDTLRRMTQEEPLWADVPGWFGASSDEA